MPENVFSSVQIEIRHLMHAAGECIKYFQNKYIFYCRLLKYPKMSFEIMYFQSSLKKHFMRAAVKNIKFLQNLKIKIHFLQKISRVSFISAKKLWVHGYLY